MPLRPAEGRRVLRTRTIAFVFSPAQSRRMVRRRLDHAGCRRRTSAPPRQRSSWPDLTFTFARARGAGADGLPIRRKLASQRPRPPSWERGTSRLSTRLDPSRRESKDIRQTVEGDHKDVVLDAFDAPHERRKEHRARHRAPTFAGAATATPRAHSPERDDELRTSWSWSRSRRRSRWARSPPSRCLRDLATTASAEAATPPPGEGRAP
jgi:hypothetical protein